MSGWAGWWIGLGLALGLTEIASAIRSLGGKK